MLIAILEWNSDKGMTPAVILADNEQDAKRAAVEYIDQHLPTPEADDVPGSSSTEHTRQNDGDINYIDGFWVRENPVPDLDDPDAVTAWLDAFKDQTTDLWLSLLTPGNGDDENTFNDVRTTK